MRNYTYTQQRQSNYCRKGPTGIVERQWLRRIQFFIDAIVIDTSFQYIIVNKTFIQVFISRICKIERALLF